MLVDVRPARRGDRRRSAGGCSSTAARRSSGRAMCGPVQGAAIGACLFEGWADDAGGRPRGCSTRGEIAFEPCHDHGAVGPMAGVLSPVDAGGGRRERGRRQPRLRDPQRGARQGAPLRGVRRRRCSTACAGSATTLGPALARDRCAAGGPIDLKAHHRPGAPDGRRVPQPQRRRDLAVHADDRPVAGRGIARPARSPPRSLDFLRRQRPLLPEPLDGGLQGRRSTPRTAIEGSPWSRRWRATASTSASA